MYDGTRPSGGHTGHGSSSSATYTTVFSGYDPHGSHTVSLSVVEAPWTSVVVSNAPYDLRTQNFLSLRVSSTLAPVPTSSTTSSNARCTGVSPLPQNQPITPTKTCPQHAQHGGDVTKSGTPTTDETVDPLDSHSEMHSMQEKGDRLTLASTEYSGYASAVNGDDTLSCSSPLLLPLLCPLF